MLTHITRHNGICSGGSRPGPEGASAPSLFVQAPRFSTDYLLYGAQGPGPQSVLARTATGDLR